MSAGKWIDMDWARDKDQEMEPKSQERKERA
jgi:hypothetical protein